MPYCRSELYTNWLVQAEPENISPYPTRIRKLIRSPKHVRKKTKVKLGLKNLAMLPSQFFYIFVHQRQKARLRSELSPNFLSTLVPNAAQKARKNLQLCCRWLNEWL